MTDPESPVRPVGEAANKQAVLDLLTGRPEVTVHRCLAQDDLVVTHATVVKPDGERVVAFDLCRLADGAVAEHWSDEEPWVDETANGHSQVDGPTEADLAADRRESRAVVEATVHTILVNNDFSDLDRYLAGEDYVQHNPRFADGISGLAAAVRALADQGVTMRYSDVLHVVAEGDFVYTHSHGSFGGTPFVFHDLFRVAGGRAAEHWDVMTTR
jgi:predicted SnoaL-like aldol condensation-catalyzing enzyme